MGYGKVKTARSNHFTAPGVVSKADIVNSKYAAPEKKASKYDKRKEKHAALLESKFFEFMFYSMQN